MKKKILSLVLVAVLALAAVGGTLAYFTDEDVETNAFIIGSNNNGGKVDIEVSEVFTQDSGLMPGVAVNKDVAIQVQQNTEDSYVWYEYLVPAALDDGTAGDSTTDILHIAFTPAAEGATATWGTPTFMAKETVNGIEYNKYSVKYSGIVKAGETTPYSMDSVTLDSSVDYVPAVAADEAAGVEAADAYYTFNGTKINYDFANGVNIIVRGRAIQAASFNGVDAAYAAYYQQNSTN